MGCWGSAHPTTSKAGKDGLLWCSSNEGALQHAQNLAVDVLGDLLTVTARCVLTDHFPDEVVVVLAPRELAHLLRAQLVLCFDEAELDVAPAVL